MLRYRHLPHFIVPYQWGISTEGNMNTKGFTIVEILVAITIIAVVVAASVSSVRKGHEITVADLHRRKARIIADSILESKSYHYSFYPSFSNDSFSVIIDTATVESTPITVSGMATVTISAAQIAGQLSTTVDYKSVTATIIWTHIGVTDTITLTKWVSRL